MFWQKRKPDNPFAPLGADMHSHLLPGVDDGAPESETSLRLARGMQSLGYRRLITTPHIYRDLYPNTPATLQPAYEHVRPALEEAGIDLRYAAEYFLDEYVEERLAAGERLLTLHENWVLVEVSFVQPPLYLDRWLFDLQMAGYKPVLAHPERYPYWHKDKNKLHELKEKGILLQVNLLSLTSYYGKHVEEAARHLLKEELVDFVGTDCHHERHLAALTRGASSIMKLLDPLLRKDKLLNPLL